MVDREPREGDEVIIFACGDEDLEKEVRGQLGIITYCGADDGDNLYTVKLESLIFVELRRGEFLLRK